MENYKQCPCHDCDEHNAEFYDCACDMGPLPEVCSEECPQCHKCDVVKNPEEYHAHSKKE